jgi:hypothetical protein
MNAHVLIANERKCVKKLSESKIEQEKKNVSFFFYVHLILFKITHSFKQIHTHIIHT